MVEVGIQPCEKEFEQVLLAHKRKEDSPYFFCTLIQKGILVGRTRFFMQAQHYDARSHAAEYPSTQEKKCVLCVICCKDYIQRY